MAPWLNLYSGKRVLVTGHTGFKGAWLCEWLLKLGAEVHGLALAPLQPSLFIDLDLASRLKHNIVDIRDPAALTAKIQEIQPEIIFHLAAQALVRVSYREPVMTFDTNAIGTAHVLEAVRVSNLPCSVVVVTTDKCYDNDGRPRNFKESDPLGGHDPYSASKACTEIATAAWRSSLSDMPAYNHRQSPLAIATARAGNVFGGGDWALDRLVPDFFRAQAAGQELEIRNPAARRPWQHVLEPLAGYLLLAEHLWNGNAQEAWNFGPAMDDVQPVSYIVDRLFGVEDGKREWRRADGHQPHEANFLALDASKARAQLGWRPRLPLGEALDWTHDWYVRQARNADAAELTLEQIARYMALAGTRQA